MYIYYKLKRVVTFQRPHVKLSSDLYWIYKYNITWNGKKKIWVRSIGKKCWPRVISSSHCSLLDIASGSLNAGGLSAPLLEYSLHLLAAAAALFALSFAPSSENHTNKLLFFFYSKLNISVWIMQSLGISSSRYCPIMITGWTCSMQHASIRHVTSLLIWMIGWGMNWTNGIIYKDNYISTQESNRRNLVEN